MTDRLIAARNSVLFGLNAQERKNGNYQNHSLIRNDWKSVDKLRDAIAYVPVIKTHEDESRHVYARARDQYLTCRVPFNGGSWMTGLEDTTPTALLTETSFGVVHSGSTDQVLFAKSSWNRAKTSANATTDTGQPMAGNVRSLLYKENEGTDIEGVPYFSKYYHQDPAETEGPIGMQPSEVRMAGSTEAVTPIMNAQLDGDEYIYDHYFQYQTYDKTDSEGTYNIAITPHYNFYLDSSPDYETAISSIPEPMIPNYYMLEIAFATGSAATPSAYKNALSLDFAMDQIETIIDKEGSLETVEGEQQVQALSQGYFQYYVSSLSSFASSSTPAYNNKYKNIAVLSEDLADNVLEEYNQITRDDRGTVSTQDDFPVIGNYPFYNHMDIPYVNQFTGGNINEQAGSIFEELHADQPEETELFLTLLQLLTIDIYNGTNTLSPTSLSFNTYDKDEGTLQSENTSTHLFFNFEEVMSLVQQYADDPQNEPAATFMNRLEILAQLYMGEVQPNDTILPNVVFIQSDAVREGEHNIDGFVNSEFQSTGFAEALLTRFEEWTRTFYDIFTGLAGPAASEEFMYVVEKRVIPPGATAANPADAPVQTLFFGKDIKTARGINYYDTQIKYGVKYQYDIKQVRLVVGNRYKYTKAFTIANSGSLHEGRAIGNALGFYAPEDIAVTNTVSFQQRQEQTGWTYIPEGGTTENHLSEQVGYFIYKFGFGSRVSQMFDAAAPYIGLYGAIDSETQPWWTVTYAHGAQEREDLFSRLPLMTRTGEGFDGNKSGGFVGGMIVEYQESDDLTGASMLGGSTDDDTTAEAGAANYYTTVSGFVTSAEVNEQGFFVGTSWDVGNESSLISMITSLSLMADDYGDAQSMAVAVHDSGEESSLRTALVAIIRETVGPDAAMAAQLFILSHPTGPPSSLASSWTRANAVVHLLYTIRSARDQSTLSTTVSSIGDFACKLETIWYDQTGHQQFNAHAQAVGVTFRDLC